MTKDEAADTFDELWDELDSLFQVMGLNIERFIDVSRLMESYMSAQDISEE